VIRCPRRALGAFSELHPGPDLGTNVVVETRLGNYSAFNGYHFTPSDYSRLRCLDCGYPWRTRSLAVGGLRDETDEERRNPPWARRRS
jgi:hypothetical protein